MIDVEGLNALLIQIVQQRLLVEMKNVLIPVIVQPMQIVKPAITEAFALADQAIQEILILKAVDQVRPNQIKRD